MMDINNWLDIIKRQKSFRSDYQLAKYWQVSTSTISQYRKGKLRLPIARCLEIAELGYYHPLEIILSLEWKRAKAEQREWIEKVYWLATIVNAPERMSARAFSTKYYRFKKR